MLERFVGSSLSGQLGRDEALSAPRLELDPDGRICLANDLMVSYEEADFSIGDFATGFEIRQGDTYISLHLLTDARLLDFINYMDPLLEQLAEEIIKKQPYPKYIVGITYPALANFAARMVDFKLFRPDPRLLPAEIIANMREIYEAQRGEGSAEQMGDPVIAFLQTEDFLQKYLHA